MIKIKKRKFLLLSGDGIGPESIKQLPQNQIVEKETLIAI